MNYKVWYTAQKRYLTDYELEHNFVGNPKNDYSFLFQFRVNLSTGHIQTDQGNSCSDTDCCSPCEMYADDDEFIILTDYLKDYHL